MVRRKNDDMSKFDQNIQPRVFNLSRRLEPMPVIMLTDTRVPIECKNEVCGAVHLYLVRDLVPNYSIRCLDCRRPIDLSSDQWTDAINATVDYYKAIIF
jgi:hypothetical protein